MLSHKDSISHSNNPDTIITICCAQDNPNTWVCTISDHDYSRKISYGGSISSNYSNIILENLITGLIISSNRKSNHVIVVTDSLFSQVWSRHMTPLLKTVRWKKETEHFLKETCSFFVASDQNWMLWKSM